MQVWGECRVCLKTDSLCAKAQSQETKTEAKAKNFFNVYHYRPQRSCGQGNVFTGVCHSVNRGSLQQGEPLRQGDPPCRETPGRENPSLPRRPPTRETPFQGEPPGRETPQQRDPLARTPPPGHTVNERPVCILPECILVFSLVFFAFAAAFTWCELTLSVAIDITL